MKAFATITWCTGYIITLEVIVSKDQPGKSNISLFPGYKKTL